jgi:predicted DNA-binding transcriptional regulator YafY
MIARDVQASRLIAILMLLQARGRMSARALAGEVETSVRTVHRDIEQLSAAGVPVRAARGRDGGFELLDGWRTELTGLTAREAEAIFLAGLPGPAAELGLGPAMASARAKLLAALGPVRADASRVGSRFHLDPSGWFRATPPPDHLVDVAAAVWTPSRLAIRYESWKGIVDRVVEPLGLVLKAGVWYLVAGVDGGPRTFRLSGIRELRSPGEPFERPPDFDLARYWAESTRQFEEGVYRGAAVVRVAPGAIAGLREISSAVAEAIDRTATEAGPDDWVRVTIPIESAERAARDLLRLGADVEVLEPPELREVMRATVRRLAFLYGEGAAPRAARR